VKGVSWRQIEAALAARPPARVADVVQRRAAVALVLREAGAGIEVLFIRRADHPQDPWSGQMAFPGGRAEPGEDLRATAVRETREEIGVDLERDAEPLGVLDEVRAMARLRPVSLTILPFVFRLRGAPVPVLSDEVQSVHWIPLDLLLDAERRSVMDYTEPKGGTLQFPCLRVEDVVIWGLTYRMLVGFQERIPPAEACLPEAG